MKNIIIEKFNARREGNIKAIHSFNEGFTNDSALWLKSMMEWMVSDKGIAVFERNQDLLEVMMEASEELATSINPKVLASANAAARAEDETYYRNRNNRNKSIKTYSNY